MSKDGQKDSLLRRVEGEVNQEIHPLLQKIQNNIKRIGLVLGAIVLVAAGITGYKYYQRTSLENARTALSRILSQEQGQARIQALEGFLPEAPAAIKQAVRLELAKQSMDQERYEKAAEYWGQAADQAEGTNLRLVAELGRAKALRLNGQLQASLSLLEDLRKDAPEAYARTLKYETAVVAEEAGRWERALAAYEELRSADDLTSSRGSFIQYKIRMLQEMIDSGNT